MTAQSGGMMPMAMQPMMPMSTQGGMMPMPMPMPGMMQGSMPPSVPSGAAITQGGMTFPGGPGNEESYVENILRMNLGKVATLYMTYENNSEWNAKIFKGVLEAAGRDHIIISDPATGKRYLLLTLNLDYITFDEPINYTLPFGSTPTR
jgi:spore germination protein Q